MKSILLIVNQAPVGTNITSEAIRAAAGYLVLGEELECKLIYLGESIISLKKNLKPEKANVDSFDSIMEMADLAEVEIVIPEEHLKAYNLTEDDLIEYDYFNIKPLTEITAMTENFDAIVKM